MSICHFQLIILVETPLKKIANLLQCGRKGVALMFQFESLYIDLTKPQLLGNLNLKAFHFSQQMF